MRKKALPCLLLVALVSGAAMAQTHENKARSKSHSYDLSVTHINDSLDCSEALKISSRDERAVQYGEETHTFANIPLRITAAHNGGISVRTSESNQIEVKVCKAAMAEHDADALRLLDQVQLDVQDDAVTVRGPRNNDDARWAALLLVRAPAGATLDLSARNGGISVRGFSGNVTARTTNGGISLRQAGGSIDASTTNGGISVRESSGDVKLRARNGGLSLKLGERWEAGSLTAETHNGGVVVEVARGFQSPIEVSLTGHGSMVCSSDLCDGVQRTRGERQRTFRLGTAEPVVKASTHNGGVVIRDPESARRSRMD
jgi:DUF4097 and DUF4098 domain-containing protein YvlB